ncbi:hypothetical protein KDW23_28475 [Burkholderia cenocepacia]|uniref:hypothetical protein n=1 Tax=Burkholderia cenocepacia TaxID=95486 RepID=UPI001B8FD7B2|nr:hypothetical protein [Burkholderia cenocepacia]MBR8073943.1 hypothetical protein [Burkholderia cenocepacia]MBR8448666.1 hypothetical protein [Burkholderia cenocepacia]
MSRDQLNQSVRAGYCGERAGSARESWISPVAVRKSLIVEESAAAHGTRIATSGAAFATGPACPQTATPLSSSLFKVLKEKKKAYREAAATGRRRAPRVRRAPPSVARGTKASRHGFRTAAMSE